MNLLFVGVGISILVAIIYLFINVYPKSLPQVLNRGPYALTGGIQVVGSSDLGSTPNAFLTAGEGAFQCFVYLDGNVRTGNASDCGTDPATPSCGTGTYQECHCGTDVNCTSCIHTGYKNLLNLYDTFKIEILTMPDASRQKSVSAQITLKTAPSQTTYAIETFPLPPFPEQKWTMITVSKKGRQIFVYYNNILVLSKKALHTFSLTPPASQIPAKAGDINLSGSLAMASFFPNHQIIPDVEKRYAQMVDTRGNLNTMEATPSSISYSVSNTGTSFFGNIISFLCLDGSCFNKARAPVVIATIPSIYSPMKTSYA